MAGKDKIPQPANVLAEEVLQSLRQIDERAKAEKEKHKEKIKKAISEIQAKIKELQAQEELLRETAGLVTGRVTGRAYTPVRKRATRGEGKELADRIIQWLGVHRDTAYNSAQLAKEFPELAGKAVSVLLKPAIAEKKIIKDGQLRGTTYQAK